MSPTSYQTALPRNRVEMLRIDQRRVNLTRFPLRFPEQRDFFLEGSSVFSLWNLNFFIFEPAVITGAVVLLWSVKSTNLHGKS